MENLRQRLKQSGWTQADLGKLLGKKQPTISSILSGNTELKSGDAKKIMGALGLTWEEIYGPPNKSPSAARKMATAPP